MVRLLIASLATVATLASAAAAQATVYVFQAPLTGAAEAPPTPSGATGSATVTIDDVADTMRIEAAFSGLSGPVTAVHIHCCTMTPLVGTAGVVTMVPVFIGFPIATSGAYDHTFSLLDAATYNPGFVSTNGGSAAIAEAVLLTGMLESRSYLNIHTATYPGGEIRGFLTQPTAGAVPEPQTWAMTIFGFGAIGAMMRRRRSQPLPAT